MKWAGMYLVGFAVLVGGLLARLRQQHERIPRGCLRPSYVIDRPRISIEGQWQHADRLALRVDVLDKYSLGILLADRYQITAGIDGRRIRAGLIKRPRGSPAHPGGG